MEKEVIKREWFIKTRPGKIEDYFSFNKNVIGQGTYGSVFKAVAKDSKQPRAIKVIPKRKVSNSERFKTEIEIMRNLDHPNIIKLYETFEDSRNIYLVIELCTGGELFDRIIDKGHFSENEARKTFSQIIKALYYLHSNKICHRDLKPENFLFLNKNDDSPIKMIDFGLSKFFGEPSTPQQQQQQQQKYGVDQVAPVERRRKSNMQTKAGTPYYISPEVLTGEYDESCDIWSAGVMLYILLCGYPPFYGNTDPQILDSVRKGLYSFDGAEWKVVSDNAKDLIKNMITKPEKRLKAGEVIKHQWMIQPTDNNAVPVLDLNFKTLRSFVGFDRLKKAALTYIASQLDETDIGELKGLFEKLDEDGNGMLSFEEIKKGIKNLQPGHINELEQILSKIDTDSSGMINYTEFLAATMEASTYLKEEKLLEAFKLFDKDGNGKITADEIKEVLGTDEAYKHKPKEFWQNIVRESDLNGDGEIDYEEFIAMMTNLKLSS